MADGSVQKLNQQLAGGDVIVDFAVSADSSRVVYDVRVGLVSDRRLFTVGPAGGPAVLIAGPMDMHYGVAAAVGISPDGSRVVFSRSTSGPGNGRLYSVASTGGPVTELSGPLPTSGSLSGGIEDFVLSPDGITVVYWGDQETLGTKEVFSVPIHGGGHTRLNGDLAAAEDVFLATITPDSTRAVLASRGSVTSLAVTPIGGGTLTPLPWPVTQPLDDRFETPIVVTPDSDRIVYSTLDDRVFSQALDGSTAVEKGSNTNDEVLQWGLAPDGSRVIVLESTDGETEMYSSTTGIGSPIKISSEAPRGTNIKSFRINPNSEFMAYLADDRRANREELFRSSLIGVGAARLSPVSFEGVLGVQDDYFFSADGNHVIYRADQEENGTLELFSVPIGGGTTIKLNSQLVFEGDVLATMPGPDASSVLYRAEQDLLSVTDLYLVDVVGSLPQRINDPILGPVGSVDEFAISPDGEYVVYRADQTIFGVTELWSVPTSGGAAVRLNEDLADGDEVWVFQIDATSSRVVFRTESELWSSPITGGGATRLAEEAQHIGFDYAITPDGLTVVAHLFLGAHSTVGVMQIGGGPVTNLLPAEIRYTRLNNDANLEMTTDGSRVVFAALDLAGGITPRHLFSVPLTGGLAVELSTDPIFKINHFAVSGDGSFSLFAAKPAGSNDLGLFGTPTDGGTAIALSPLSDQFQASEYFPFAADPDGSHAVFILDGDLFSALTDSGLIVNLTADLSGMPQRFDFTSDGSDVVVFRGPAPYWLRQADVLDIDGGERTALTAHFPDPRITDLAFAGGERLVMRIILDDSVDGTGETAIYQTSLLGPPGTILNLGSEEDPAVLRVEADRVVFGGREGVYTTDVSCTRAPLLVRPWPIVFSDYQLEAQGGYLVYTAVEETGGLMELWSVELGSILFSDGFESGSLSRWTSSIGVSSTEPPELRGGRVTIRNPRGSFPE